MRILVTGGAGFIGSHLCDALLARGDEVVALDALTTGRRENLAGHLAPPDPRFRLVEGSVTDEVLVSEWIGWADRVYHLAAAVGVRYVIENPLQSLETNVRGTEIVLTASARRGVPVFLASTSEVYGKNPKIPFREDDDSLLGPTTIVRWGYSCSKALDEFLALAYHREKGLPVVIGRYFNTTGARQTGAYGMVVPRFARAAIRGEALAVFGDGTQTRCFTDVEDAVRITMALMDSPAANGEIVNVGGAERVSIGDLARRVIAAAGSASRIELVPYREAFATGFEEMLHRVPDISKVKRLTGLSPRISLDECIGRVLESVRKEEAS